MRQLVQEFPQQLKTALEIAAGIQLPDALGQDCHQVLVVGLGGSAFGGEISRNLMLTDGKVPVTIHRNYGLPSHVNANTLCLLCSYSGNTEETLDAAELAVKAGAKCVAISSGGKLEGFSADHDLPFIKLPEGYPPRAAVGLSFVQQLEVLTQTGLYTGDYKTAVNESISLLEAFDEHRRPLSRWPVSLKGISLSSMPPMPPMPLPFACASRLTRTGNSCVGTTSSPR